MKHALLIPLFEPNERALPFLKRFKEGDFDAFLVVNDGSSPSFDSVFKAIEEESPFHVLSLETNKGKGAALKQGIARLLEEHPDLDFILTADGDGQHTYEDILRVKQTASEHEGSLVLGVRDFSSKVIPLRSRFGNRFSASYFKMATKKRIRDTQTGLRAIPASCFQLALQTDGSRYEYEMTFLMDAARCTDLQEVEIATVYDNEKAQSHFRPIRDSLRIYRAPFLYGFVSVASWGIDLLLFYLLSTFVFTSSSEAQVFASSMIARVTSGAFNFLMLHLVVFHNRGDLGNKGLRYALLWAINLALSSGLTYAFKFIPIGLTFVKFAIDTVIAIANYFINLGWVFVNKKRGRKPHE